VNLSDAAVTVAQHWPVFPCTSLKKPCTTHGFHDATRDVSAARDLFRQHGAKMIGVPTGEESDLAVWDFDTKHDGAGLKWLAENEHRIPPTRRHRTPSGGIHLLFRYPKTVRFGKRRAGSTLSLARGECDTRPRMAGGPAQRGCGWWYD